MNRRRLIIFWSLWIVLIFGAFFLGSFSQILEDNQDYLNILLLGAKYKIFSLLSLVFILFGSKSSRGLDVMSYILLAIGKSFLIFVFIGFFIDDYLFLDISLFTAFSVYAAFVAYFIGKLIKTDKVRRIRILNRIKDK